MAKKLTPKIFVLCLLGFSGIINYCYKHKCYMKKRKGWYGDNYCGYCRRINQRKIKEWWDKNTKGGDNK